MALGCFGAHNEPHESDRGFLPFHEYVLSNAQSKYSFLGFHRRLPGWEGAPWEQSGLRARYRPVSWLKLGVGYVWQKGARHNVDWVKENGDWLWRSTQGRREKLAQLELIPRFLWAGAVWEWRQTLSRNDFTEETKLVSRLGASFHRLWVGEVRTSLFAQYESHIPFGDKQASESWIYLAALFHANDSVKLGPQAGCAGFKWTSTDEYEKNTGNNYSVSEDFCFAGLRILNVF